MTALSLSATSCALLTKTTTTTDPNNPTGPQLVNSFLCDIKGNRLLPGEPPIKLYRDQFTAKTFALIAEVIPSGTATADKELAASILALNPVHYTSKDGDVRGYFVEAPDFNEREGK